MLVFNTNNVMEYLASPMADLDLNKYETILFTLWLISLSNVDPNARKALHKPPKRALVEPFMVRYIIEKDLAP